MKRNTTVIDSVEDAVDRIISAVGKDIKIGMPLGLGKPNQLINALYARAKQDSDIHLTILTALSLEKPTIANSVEERFMGPFLKRVFGDCPDLAYAVDVSRNAVPDNVEVREFFFAPGSRLRKKSAQQDYISSNYTHAARDVFNQGCNVVAQLIALADTDKGPMASMSCNPDTGPELVELLEAEGRPHIVIGQVNQNLPYMENDAEVPLHAYDLIIDHEDNYTKLFSTPKSAVGTADYMIGLHASSLIRDGGTLQLGIGALADAITYSAILRHQDNVEYNRALENTGIASKFGNTIDKVGGTDPFGLGLYGATEMFVDGFAQLIDAKILVRKVYDFWALQQLVNEGKISENNIERSIFEHMDKLGVRVLRTKDFDILQYHGVFVDDCSYEDGYIIAPGGERIVANVANPESRGLLVRKCLGKKLRNGKVLHGGFFLGPNDFYEWLHALPEDERREICMTGVNKINQLDMNPRLYKQQRIHARFINTGLMATMNGAVVSDGLENGRVVSGVGGQYNFVEMAHHLPTGRSILMIRAVRSKGDDVSSNVVWNYGHCTIPRHLRDIVVTEYGIADLRSKTDSEVIKAMLNIADSRFQEELLATAIAEGKVEESYEIPLQFRNNTPEKLERDLQPFREDKLFPVFPFGSDLTSIEKVLGKALVNLKELKGANKVKQVAQWLRAKGLDHDELLAAKPFLERMDLTNPADSEERRVQLLLAQELHDMGVLQVGSGDAS